MKAKAKWVGLLEVPRYMKLDGLRVRYRKRVLGHIRSGWGGGLWLIEKNRWGTVKPWFPPGRKTIADVAGDLEIEVKQ